MGCRKTSCIVAISESSVYVDVLVHDDDVSDIVDGGGGDGRMAQEFLDHPQVSASVQEMCGE